MIFLLKKNNDKKSYTEFFNTYQRTFEGFLATFQQLLIFIQVDAKPLFIVLCLRGGCIKPVI